MTKREKAQELLAFLETANAYYSEILNNPSTSSKEYHKAGKRIGELEDELLALIPEGEA